MQTKTRDNGKTTIPNATPNAVTPTPAPDETALAVVTSPLPEYAVPADVTAVLERTAHLREHAQSEFAQGSENLPLWASQLIGVPFVVTSEPHYAHQPQTQTRLYAQDVVQFTVRLLDLAAGKLLDAKLATLSGAYLLNQVRSMTLHELLAPVWTIAENTSMPALRTPRQNCQYVDDRGRPISYPYMLKLFNPQTDKPAVWLEPTDEPF